MPSLKSLRTRINSVKSTRKITSAMKMVAASKLRRAQAKAEAARPYAQSLGQMMQVVLSTVTPEVIDSKFLKSAHDRVHLFVVISSDRGLCGGFNSNLIRKLRLKIAEVENAGKIVKLITIGRKARQLLLRDHGSKIVHHYQNFSKNLPLAEVSPIADQILDMMNREEFDMCHLVYNEFQSVISQEATIRQIIPVADRPISAVNQNEKKDSAEAATLYEFEPDEETILEALLPKNFLIQLYQAVLESAAGEQGARMTAMDNATRNAGDMIKSLTLNYNRTRQAVITKELIEIISGAEAV